MALLGRIPRVRHAWLLGLVVPTLAASCYPDRVPERRVRVETGDGDGDGDSNLGGSDFGGAKSGDGDSGGTSDTGGSQGSGGSGTGGGPSPDVCIVRVDVSSGASLPDGASWETAFSHPKPALDYIEDKSLQECTLWIAEGDYLIESPGLQLLGMQLLGGFDGNETSEEERSPEARAVSLDGDGTADTILTLTDATIDGVTVTGGALGILAQNGSNHIKSVDVYDNGPTGGVVVESAASITVEHSRLFQNSNVDSPGGGAVYAKAGSSLVARDSVFANNRAGGNDTSEQRRGGAINWSGQALTVSRCIFVGNSSSVRGGAVSLSATDWRIEDSVFVGNAAPTAAAVDASLTGLLVGSTVYGNSGGETIRGSSTVLNSILWNNEMELPSGADEPDVLVSFVEGGYSGGTSQDIIVSDPKFVGEVVSANTTSVTTLGTSSLVGHDATITQGTLEGLFLEVTAGDGAGYYYIMDNPSDSMQILGAPPQDVGSQPFIVHDLHLTASSPAIDRARGTTPMYEISGTDVEGTARRDVSAVPNTGVGDPTYVDVGAYER